MKRLLIFPVFFLWFLMYVNATPVLDKVFSDNMVLQRDKNIRVSGRGIPGEGVEIIFGGKIKSTQVGNDSLWVVNFPPRKSCAVPHELIVRSGGAEIVLRNILIGDVWLCSGQSNMEWTMGKEMYYKQALKSANQPLVRFCNPWPAGRYVYGEAFKPDLLKRLTPGNFYRWEKWQICDSTTLAAQSAVAYYFAKMVAERTGVPVGIVNVSLGGAPIETFIARDALAASKQFAPKVKPGNWLNNESLPVWPRERGRQNVGSQPDAFADDLGPNHGYKPGFAFEGGVKSLSQLAIKGVLWYQGESNAQETERVEEYDALFMLMVRNYRAEWKNQRMPFYWVQLSSIDTLHYKSHFWPQFRDLQRLTLRKVRHGGMAVSSDIGSRHDVHPTNKKDVGERLARWALAQDYGQEITPSGPLPLKAKYRKGQVEITFQYSEGLKTSTGNEIKGFSTDGKTEIRAFVERDRVIIPVSEKPGFVYYGWKPFSDANLVNGEGLPASTFKIEVK
ncbi:MAG: sialate O-acetylesterase [Bacteroidia bacterium]|nr:sialate O-acetylesterase [Bacteroidia bacterium]